MSRFRTFTCTRAKLPVQDRITFIQEGDFSVKLPASKTVFHGIPEILATRARADGQFAEIREETNPEPGETS